jgi:hypothetical protein
MSEFSSIEMFETERKNKLEFHKSIIDGKYNWYENFELNKDF